MSEDHRREATTEKPLVFEDGTVESKSAFKKRIKAQEAAAKKAAKDAAKPAPKAGAKKEAKEEEILDPTQYYANRSKAVSSMKDNEAYPHKFHTTHRIPDLLAEFSSKAVDGERISGTIVSIAGRVKSVRGQGKLFFYDLRGDGHKVQVMR
jgi:lysyl-tRNA synthetase class 2|tara:strand:+ start:1605 stop:2057 length:453 start_codon:yes stop_codon:yes gene_type:complete